MFESTFQLLADRPVTLPAFLVALWISYRFLRRFSRPIGRLAFSLTTFTLVPLFLALFAAEYTGHPRWQWAADGITALAEAGARRLVAFVDALFAAWLRTFLVVLESLGAGATEFGTSAGPALSTFEFLAVVFGFGVFAGAALIYTLHYASRRSDLNGWLIGTGVVFALTGLFASIVRLERWQVGESALVMGLVTTAVGLTVGVSVVITVARPDFGASSTSDRRRESGDSPLGRDDEDGLLATTAARAKRLMPRRET